MTGRHVRWLRRVPRVPRVGEWGLVPLALGLVFLPMAELDDLPPPIAVTVNDRVVMLVPGATLGDLLERHGLAPGAGDLLDVEGVPLDEGRYPGHVQVNGAQAGSALMLVDGDRVSVVDGEDRPEGTKRYLIEVPPGRPGNPQSFLASQPGTQVLVTGRRSGKVVSSTFRPEGPSRQPREVALTFDDGPSSTWTPRILNVLKRRKAKATFFVVGSLAARYPELVGRERAMGMAIGNHTMNHPFRSPFGRQILPVIEAEIRGATRVLGDLGVTLGLFRPPGGSWSPRVVDAARAVDQRVVLWSLDSRDWTGLSARRIAARVLQGVRPGSIVLLHDGGGNRGPTVAALPRIITGLRNRGLRLVTL